MKKADTELKLFDRIAKSGDRLIHRGMYGDTKVIVKHLRVGAPRSEVLKLAAEYATVAEFRSPYIPKALSFFESNDTAYAVFEDSGGTALNRLLIDRTFALSEIFHIAKAVTEALKAVHHQHITHRDINPSNIAFNPTDSSVHLFDFGISTKLDRTTSTEEATDNAEGTLNYLSPEQTGKTNYFVDYRTDFFSLGATLYELVTGRPPFAGNDSTETLHRILAVNPISPRVLRPECPRAFVHIIDKLLAKSPEERYLSATGLARDLAQAETLLIRGDLDADFTLGSGDLADRFEVPRAVYGREKERLAVMERLQLAVAGSVQFIELTGVSGIGKSALVTELKPAMMGHRALYAEGKFDQFKRNIPYLAFTQALVGLVNRFLRLDEPLVKGLREHLASLPQNTRSLLSSVVPNITNLLGSTGDTPLTEGEGAALKLHEVAAALLRACATPTTPVVLFLDDLQWADASSLAFLRYLAAHLSDRPILFVLAYRNNELTASHPAAITLDTLRALTGRHAQLRLGPLDLIAINTLIKDTLKTNLATAQPLAKIVELKTSGNPFFIRSFLTHLHSKNVLRPAADGPSWTYDLTEVRACPAADNVVELLLAGFATLSSDARRFLGVAACIGRQFSVADVALATGTSSSVVVPALVGAVDSGYLDANDHALEIPVRQQSTTTPADGKTDPTLPGLLRFAHDRVHQAATEMLTANDRADIHCHLAQLMLNELPQTQIESQLFEIVDHLNQGVTSPASIFKAGDIAALNLRAGVKAQSGGSHEVAAPYLEFALTHANQAGHSAAAQTLILDARLSLARAYRAMSKHSQCLALLATIEATVMDKMIRAQALDIAAAVHIAMRQYDEAIQTSLRGMKLLVGITMNRRVTDLEVVLRITHFKLFHLEPTIQYLEQKLEQPSDPKWLLVFDLALKCMTAAFYVDQNIFVVLLQKIFLKIRREQVPVSQATLVIALSMMVFMIRDVKSARRIQAAAHARLEKFGEDAVFPLFYIPEGHWLGAYSETYTECAAINQRGYDKAAEYGDPGSMGVNAFLSYLNAIGGGFRLIDLESLGNRYRHFFTQVNPDNYYTYAFLSLAQTARALKGLTNTPTSMTDTSVTEEQIAAGAAHSPGDISIFTTMQSWLAFNSGDDARSWRLSRTNIVQKVLPGCFTGAINLIVLNLAVLRARRNGRPLIKPKFLESLLVNVSLFEFRWWDSHRFVNKGLRDLLVAEWHRTRGRIDKALAAYQIAITRLAEANNFYWHAYAHQAAGETLFEAQITNLAAHHLAIAISRWSDYGAEARGRELEAKYHAILDQHATSSDSSTGNTARTMSRTRGIKNESFDIQSLAKASHAIAGAIDPKTMNVHLLHIAMENVGATHGTLITEIDDHITVALSAKMQDGVIADKTGDGFAATSAQLPLSLLQFVCRTNQTVLLNRAASNSDYADDPYIKNGGAKSILCAPMLYQNAREAILLLENRLIENAFTENRVEVLAILATQGAISLRNGRFIADIRGGTDKIERLKSQLETVLNGTKLMASCQSIDAAVAHAFKLLRDEIRGVETATFSAVIRNGQGENIHLAQVGGAPLYRLPNASGQPDQREIAATFPNELSRRTGDGTLLLPVRWKGDAIGLISTRLTDSDQLVREHRNYLEMVAQSLGMALKNIEHQNHLEDLVQMRTKAMNQALTEVTRKRQKIRTITENIDQGIMTFDGSLRIDDEYSRFVASIFEIDHAAIINQDIIDLVVTKLGLSPEEIHRIRETLLASVGEDSIAWTLNASKLPHVGVFRQGARQKHLELDWTPIRTGELVAQVMLTVRDVTEKLETEAKLRHKDAEHTRKMQIISSLINADRIQLQRFFEDASTRLSDVESLLAQSDPDMAGIFRHLHTIKGAALTLGQSTLANFTHETEDLLPAEKRAFTNELKTALKARITLLSAEFSDHRNVFREIFGTNDTSAGEWSIVQLAGQFMPRVLATVREGNLAFGGLTITEEICDWSANGREALTALLPHCVNNALDHGYLLPQKAGQALGPVTISIEAKQRGSEVLIRILDRGAGIDHAALRSLAARRGIAPAKYLDVIFLDGASTATSISVSSGRGIGMSAVREWAKKLGGDVRLLDNELGGSVCEIRMAANSCLKNSTSLMQAS